MADPLSIIGSVVGIVSLGITATDGLIDYYNAFRGQREDIRQMTENLTNLREVLQSLAAQWTKRSAQGAIPRELIDSANTLCETCGELVEELETELKKITKTPGPGTRNTLRYTGQLLAYPFRQSTLNKLNEYISEIVRQLSLRMQLFLQGDVCGIQGDIVDAKVLLGLIKADQQTLQQDVSSIQTQVIDSRAILKTLLTSQISMELRSWLKAPDAYVEFNAAIEKKHPGTGSWFTNSPQYNTWLSKENSFLWLVGFAGCGKSILCSHVIQHLFAHRIKHASIGVAFFFFTFSDESKRDASAMLRTVLLQLSAQVNSSSDHLTNLYAAHGSGTPSISALTECLLSLCKDLGDVCIVMDGVDEVPKGNSRSQLLDTIRKLRESHSGIHLLVASRDENDIRQRLHAESEDTVPLRNSTVDEDIARFIAQRLRDDELLQDLVDFHSIIEEELTSRADGVFRWVECQLTSLADCPASEELVRIYLQELPTTLSRTYIRILSSIPRHSREYAKQLLTIVCFSKKPLTVEALAQAAAIQLDDDPRYDPRRVLHGFASVQKICPGLLQLFVSGGHRPKQCVRLSHFSVQEFLLSDNCLHNASVASFALNPKDGNSQMTSICLAVVLNADTCLQIWPYAAEVWPIHFSSLHETPIITQQLEKLFFTKSEAFQTWITFFKRPFHYDVEALMEKRYGNWTALTIASEYGCEAAVECLIRYGAKVDARTDYTTALVVASERGHKTVVRLLLASGADVNQQAPVDDQGRGWTALEAACFGGHVEVSSLLLKEGAHIVTHSRSRFASAVAAATSNGHASIVQLLIDHGADVNATCTSREATALIRAAVSCSVPVVQLLIDNGADVNAQTGSDDGTALAAVAPRRSEALIKLPIRMAKPFPALHSTGHNKTPPEILDSERILRLLLKAGADVNAAGGIHGTALQSATTLGETVLVRILIEAGADVDLQIGGRGTPLQIALKGRFLDICVLLIENGARVPNHLLAQDHHLTEILVAENYPEEEVNSVIDFLLKYAADIRMEGNTAFDVANSLGYPDVAHLISRCSMPRPWN